MRLPKFCCELELRLRRVFLGNCAVDLTKILGLLGRSGVHGALLERARYYEPALTTLSSLWCLEAIELVDARWEAGCARI